MKKHIIVVALLAQFSTVGMAETGRPPQPESVERGQILYRDNCQQCHRANGEGERIPDLIRNPNFLPAIPLNEKSHAWHHGDAQLVRIIRKGNKRMPAFDRVLSEPQLRDLVAYMKSLWSTRILACQGPKHMSCM